MNTTRLLLRRFSTSTRPKTEKKDLNAVLDEAEELVGYSLKLSFGWVLDRNLLNLMPHAGKFVTDGNQLQKIWTQMVVKEDRSVHALFMLLLSKACGFKKIKSEKEIDPETGILHKQRTVVEVCELMRSILRMHHSVVNYKSSEYGTNKKNLGNKLSVLGGDYLLATCFKRISSVNDQNINEMLYSTIKDSAEGSFFGLKDFQNNPLPAKQLITTKLPKDFEMKSFEQQDVLGNAELEWTMRNLYNGGLLMAKGCQSVLTVAGHDEHAQKQGFIFGLHLSLAWQAYKERNAFTSKLRMPFGITSAPVLFHLLQVPGLYKEIEKGLDNVNEIDMEVVRKSILDSPALEQTKELETRHFHMAFEALQTISADNSQKTIKDIIDIIQEK